MGSSPSPPDPTATANTQQGFNVSTAADTQAMNAINQSNPYSSLTYTQTGTGPNGVPIYSSSLNLSPQQQSLLNTLQGTQQVAGNQANTLLTNANYGAQNPSDVIGNSTSGLTSDLMGKEVGYLQPFYTQQTSQLDSQLKNQGFKPGDPGYDQAMRALETQQAGTVQNFEANIEPQAYQQATSSYMLPLSMAGTEMGLSQPASATGSLVQTPQTSVAPVDYSTLAEQNYQQQMSSYNNMMSGLFGAAGKGLGGWMTGAGLGSAGGAAAGGSSGILLGADALGLAAL